MGVTPQWDGPGSCESGQWGVIVIGKVDDVTIMQARVRGEGDPRHRVHQPDDCRIGAVRRNTREGSFELEQQPVGDL